MTSVSGACLAFDFGRRHIGVAVGHTETQLCQPLSTVQADQGRPDWEGIARLIHEWKPRCLVVGLPRNMDDSDGPLTHEARRFGERLAGRFGLPVHFVDERLTTHMARQDLYHSGVRSPKRMRAAVDALAASRILETWMGEGGMDTRDNAAGRQSSC